MATGANDAYWKDARLPGVVKHGILRRYAAVYLGRTCARTGVAVHLDGYAGRGYHDDGSVGSAGMAMQFALDRLRLDGKRYVVRLFEKDRTNFQHLSDAVEHFKRQGIDVSARNVDVLAGISDVIAEADGHPLFMFLDPCGVGLPLDVIVQALNRSRDDRWPPTEVLLNFSLEAVRRIGGALAKGMAPEASLSRLDATLGGNWWRDFYTRGYESAAAEDVLRAYCGRLAADAGMAITAVPVSRAPSHKPIYYLVFATRNPRGYWNFSNAAAKSIDDWWAANEAIEQDSRDGQLELIPASTIPRLADVEKEAVTSIEQNILKLLEDHPSITVGDKPISVLGEYYGRVGETVVRKAIKNLHKQGLTSSTGVGPKIENLVVARPTP